MHLTLCQSASFEHCIKYVSHTHLVNQALLTALSAILIIPHFNVTFTFIRVTCAAHCNYYRLGVPEQALGGISLGFVEDKPPPELSLYYHII